MQEPCANLFLRNGIEISCRILEITPEMIKYIKCNLQNSPEISILKTEVLMLKYSNGDKDLDKLTEVTWRDWLDNYKGFIEIAYFFNPI